MRNPIRLVVLCLFSSALLMCLTACSIFGNSSLNSTPTPTPTPAVTSSYAVPDTYNNRVLIYDNVTPVSTDQPASVVLGQADFTTNGFPSVAANTFDYPTSLAVDPVGDLYVADWGFCRVLVFAPPFTNNMSAIMVIGQANMTTSTCAAGASTLGNVYAVAFDGSGNLWVSDATYSRIVEFTPPFSTGMSATLVIGQTSLSIAGSCNQGTPAAPTASTLCDQWDMNFDSSGNLWVADHDNNRILEFKPPFSNDMAASLELGQPSGATAFTSQAANNGGISATTLYKPAQPAFDGYGNLWVADSYNNRILEYTPPFSNGMAATLELGQPSGASAFTTNALNTSQSGFFYPIGISFDSSGYMQVADIDNSRVMIFVPPFSNGMNATTVLGQADFTHGAINQSGSVGANTLYWPFGGVDF
jgi:sugar lactone lactonase YvrE